MNQSSTYEQLEQTLTQSRWFDGRWMRLCPHEGTPALGQFGLLSGPEYKDCTFYHELAHAMIAVLDEEPWRLDSYHFGLNNTTRVRIHGQEYIEPETDNATHLELRVIALQWWLMQMDQGPWSLEKSNEFLEWHVGSLRYMADFIILKYKLIRSGAIPESMSYTDQEASAIKTMVSYCITYAEAFNQDRVQALWNMTCNEALKLKQENSKVPAHKEP